MRADDAAHAQLGGHLRLQAFRGSPVDLARHTRDNVARLQLN